MIIFWIVGVIVLLFGFVVFRGAPYVPSKRRDIKEAFASVYKLSSKDLLVDIGSGDGIVLLEAAQCQAKTLGYELNPILVLVAKFRLRKFSNSRVKLADFWYQKLPPDTTILYAFSESRDITKIARKIQSEANRLKKNLFFMSYSFEIPGLTVVKKNDMMFLYEFKALHSDEAQV